MARPSTAADGRFISSPTDVIAGKKAELEGRITIIAALAASTSSKISELMAGLETEKADKDLNAVWKAAEFVYQRDTSLYPINEKQGITKELHLALIAYVLVGFYNKFNEATRLLKSVSDVKSYPYKNYFKLLLLGVIRVPGTPPGLPKNIMVYRGIKNVKLDVDPKAGYFAFQHFTSTSRNRQTALGYAGKGERTLFEIENIMGSGLEMGKALGISNAPNVICLDHVLKNDNFECLVWPMELFKVMSVEDQPDGLRVIHLKAGV